MTSQAQAVVPALEAAGYQINPGAVASISAYANQEVDLDGDGQTDFRFAYGGSGYNIDIVPLENNGITNRVFQSGGEVTKFYNPQDILDADPNDAQTTTAFIGYSYDWLYGGYIGFIFDIPGGSPYYGALELPNGSVAGGTLDPVSAIGYQKLPEPGTAALAGLGALAYGVRRSRRKPQPQRHR